MITKYLLKLNKSLITPDALMTKSFFDSIFERTPSLPQLLPN